MGTQYSELIRRCLIGFPRTDGEAILAIQQSINDSIQAIAALEEASSLLVTTETAADTVDGTKSYTLTTLGLTRPKNIYSIRLEDTTNSRKLKYVNPQHLDEEIPYPEGQSEGKPLWYTQFGDTIELFPIPDAAYDIWIRYSQWPVALADGTDESPYGAEWDYIIVFLAKDIANAYLNGEYIVATDRAAQYLKLGMKAAREKPDSKMVARPFNAAGDSKVIGNYYEDPFIKGVR